MSTRDTFVMRATARTLYAATKENPDADRLAIRHRAAELANVQAVFGRTARNRGIGADAWRHHRNIADWIALNRNR